MFEKNVGPQKFGQNTGNLKEKNYTLFILIWFILTIEFPPLKRLRHLSFCIKEKDWEEILHRFSSRAYNFGQRKSAITIFVTIASNGFSMSFNRIYGTQTVCWFKILQPLAIYNGCLNQIKNVEWLKIWSILT